MRLRTHPSPSASMSPFILIIVISCLLATVMSDLVSSSSRSSRSSETKKEAPELLHQTASSNNIASEQRIIPNYHSPPSEREDAYSSSTKHRSSSEPRSNIISTSSSETSLRTGLGSSGSRGYGYPHLIAPTLPPFLSSRIDSFENDAIPHSSVSIDSASDNPKRSSSHRGLFDDDDEDDDDFEDRSPKRRGPYLKKHKKPSSFYDEDDDDSIESFSFSPPSDGYSSYREPRYRNFADLDSGYKHRPRDYDVPVSSYGSYGGSTSSSPYSSEVPTSKSRPPTSPRDPYLSPSSKPSDGFYPKVPKDSSYSSLYGPSRKRSRGYKSSSFDSSPPPPPPSRGYGSTSSSGSSYGSPHHDDDDDFQLSHGGYVKSHKYNGGPKLHSDTSYKSPRGGSSYGSEFLARDNPIVGDTRKRLLDYAGASDIYMGEPDYLGGTARKPLFGGLEDDYYGRGRRVNLKDFLFDESKNVPVRAKRQVRENTRFIKAEVVGVVPRDDKSIEAKLPSIELQNLSRQKDAPSSSKDIPNCARNSSLSICLTDNEYPTEAVGKAVAENIQLLLQMSGGNIEVVTKGTNSNKKKPTSVDDEGQPLSVCASSKGDANPVRAKDTQGVWRIIVNEEGVQQSVFMDVCRFPEEPCEFVPSAIATKCIQKFSSQTLLTYDADDGLAMHEFPIPSACSCSVGRLIRIRSS